MWDKLKKAWTNVKAGTLATGAWIKEVAFTGDIAKANRKFSDTYDSMMLSYTAQGMAGQVRANMERVVNNIQDRVSELVGEGPEARRAQERDIRQAREDHKFARQQEELNKKQAKRHDEGQARRNAIRAKYGIPLEGEHNFQDAEKTRRLDATKGQNTGRN